MLRARRRAPLTRDGRHSKYLPDDFPRMTAAARAAANRASDIERRVAGHGGAKWPMERRWRIMAQQAKTLAVYHKTSSRFFITTCSRFCRPFGQDRCEQGHHSFSDLCTRVSGTAKPLITIYFWGVAREGRFCNPSYARTQLSRLGHQHHWPVRLHFNPFPC